MKKLTLHHSLTFPELDAKNEALCGLLCVQEPDIEQLRQLVIERDQLVLSHLENLEEESKKSFAEAELACNKQLIDVIQPMLDETETSLTSFLRSRKAIRNYQK
ncbi:hypothetical protein [Lacimicrobium alkaliphilum]|uniref:Uncharacterized protein n=1 Tax=Lacimicrobium alkaliphilum TaxID=1526571 RepID=A0ABQ1RK13_9ALTE|nr:hypothetical protein [Lacimicrobium alkaliphilum]GGD72364.1 hypothetical protein GCM10011357_29210 [Lacimicrobium alkaliphilum]